MAPASPAAILADVAAVGLLLTGVLGLALPGLLSRGYGLPVTGESGIGFVRATSMRDLALGAVFLAASLRGDATVLLAAAVAGLVVSFADFLIVFAGGGRVLRPPLAAHTGGAIVFAILIALLLPIVRL